MHRASDLGVCYPCTVQTHDMLQWPGVGAALDRVVAMNRAQQFGEPLQQQAEALNAAAHAYAHRALIPSLRQAGFSLFLSDLRNLLTCNVSMLLVAVKHEPGCTCGFKLSLESFRIVGYAHTK